LPRVHMWIQYTLYQSKQRKKYFFTQQAGKELKK
jgi:hypothetical protein